ncbi:TIGR03089 family protein [Oerskovia turbata]|uniref:TIGR03089 family protein n=1 Tax=Oerskovia turbata TaxID=1713 RepID=A0A4V1N548_9CELL|nr:TIGR03089 family protein [Oerskovia turbata]RXR26719.1 TIGR03089 family protein [Oerskovia turbata]RXR34416.1 TIGR03089 family protein [Oerskovia turbata]TGJ97731.1 TIGR03089 family protein [Actinotalea fermentans ATCC 43279 = JCM 9966 = DSM 3133]
MTESSTTPMHIADLQSILTRDPGRPRVTWYGDDDERVELSGAVLHNWINKTVNLLVEELDAAPGVRVLLDLPPHWRAIVWALATWRTGATLVLPPATEGSAAVGPEDVRGIADADVVVTSRPAAWAGTSAQLVAVPLPALARRFDGDLPPGTIDAGSAVMTYGDQIGWVEEIDPTAVAIEQDDEPAVRHADLVVWATGTQPASGGNRRVMLEPTTPRDVVRRTLDLLTHDGSVVLLSSATSARLTQDPGAQERLRQSERLTA